MVTMANPPITLEKARAAKTFALRSLSNIDGINGIGISRKGSGYAIKVNCEGEPPEEIPKRINGVDVIVEVVGKIRKRSAQKGHTVLHVVPHKGRWAVERDGAQRVSSIHRTQRDAAAIARARARKARGTVVIHSRDGSIRSRDRYTTHE